MSKFKEYKETQCKGNISIEQISYNSIINGTLGIQIASDGRVWICIDGQSFLRFRPEIKGVKK